MQRLKVDKMETPSIIVDKMETKLVNAYYNEKAFYGGLC